VKNALLFALVLFAAAARADAPSAQYTVLSGGTNAATVWDSRTLLEWTQAAQCVSSTNNTPSCTWQQALAACASLNSTSFAGHTDWRLASIKELQTLADRRLNYYYYGRAVLDPTAFPGTPPGVTLSGSLPVIAFWSSSPSAIDPAQAWYVDFAYGSAQRQSQITFLGYARCVRDRASGG
jgi:hypothetical protein